MPHMRVPRPQDTQEEAAMSEPSARSRFVQAMRGWYVGHYHVEEDCWFSCPMHPESCNERPKKCECGQAENETQKRDAVDAFADEVCAVALATTIHPAMSATSKRMHSDEQHQACRTALRKECGL